MERYANSVMFGFDFQSNAAIVLMVKNMAEMDTIRIEGEEDIEIGLSDGTYVLAQAKAVEKASTDFSNVRAKAEKAMKSLSEASKKVTASQLIYITNSPDPFKDKASKPMFYGKARVKYAALPEQTQKVISGWLSKIESPLNTDALTIQVLPFETDDEDQRYKVVIDAISDFIGGIELSNYDGLRKRLHEVWQMMLDKNGTKTNRDIKLTKKDVVWPIIVFVTGRNCLDRYSRYCADIDEGEYYEISRRYRELIEETSERFDIAVKVVTDFYEKKLKGQDAIEQFIDKQWANYEEVFGLNAVEEPIKSSLTKVILYNILRKRFEINKIKQSVKL